MSECFAMLKFIWLPDAQTAVAKRLTRFNWRKNILFYYVVKYFWKITSRFGGRWHPIHPCYLGLVGDIWSYIHAYNINVSCDARCAICCGQMTDQVHFKGNILLHSLTKYKPQITSRFCAMCLRLKSYLVVIVRYYSVRVFRNVEVYMIDRRTNYCGQTAD